MMKTLSKAGVLIAFVLTLAVANQAAPAAGEASGGTNGLFELFNEQLPPGARWTSELSDSGGSRIRRGGLAGSHASTNYFYLRRSDSPVSAAGLAIPIRANPGPGEYRYLSFAWIKWGSGPIALQLHDDSAADGANAASYAYFAGEGDLHAGKAVRVSAVSEGGWLRETRDLWKDFGDFTITGISFIAIGGRDAGFDTIFLAKQLSDFANSPPILPSQVMMPEPVPAEGVPAPAAAAAPADDSGKQTVDIDWAAQVKAGGWMMYPLYLAGLAAIIIAIQRMVTVRESRLAPEPLRVAVRDRLARGEFDAARQICDRHPSTLGEALRFVLLHRHAGFEIVSQSAGDIAARDIRDHLARIYPLSLIASLSPLLGLLGTIVGMIQAFALVSLYGDQGGAAILSDSISKALITTAAGLIIAAPSIAIYFVIKNRIMSLASLIEVEIENAITVLYLKEDTAKAPGNPNRDLKADKPDVSGDANLKESPCA